MKLHNFIYTILLLISFNGLSKSTISYQTERIKFDYEGNITLKIWDSKKGSKYKLDQARKDALHSVLLVGSSNDSGCQNEPAILHSDIEIANFKLIEKESFYIKDTWSNFTRISSVETTIPIKKINESKDYTNSINYLS